MRYEPIPKELFIKNRKRYLAQMPLNSISFFCSNAVISTNGDGTLPFIQSSAFFYLTGIDQEDSFLIMTKTKSEQNETLFIKETNDKIKVWEGEKLNKIEAQNISGIKNVVWSKSFFTRFVKRAEAFKLIYFHQDLRLPKNHVSLEIQILEKIKAKFLAKKYKNAYEIVNELRVIKQDEEIVLIKKAIEITKKGLLRALKFIKPNVKEFEIEAEISHEFTMNSSRRHAFSPIMASGKNACILHYIENNKSCLNGDLLLMDFGAEYANYNADLSRTVAVNGKFTARQKEVYDAVLRVFKFAKSKMLPGNNLVNLKKEVFDKMGEELMQLGLIKTNTEAEIRKYYPHGVSHFLGLDVHDVGDKNRTFTKGMLLTCEPGIYISEEGIGIRIENDILITEFGNEDLMEDFPLEIDEIEQLMK